MRMATDSTPWRGVAHFNCFAFLHRLTLQRTVEFDLEAASQVSVTVTARDGSESAAKRREGEASW
jgi:hypothetical protein